MCDFLRVIAWFCDEKFSLKKSCFYLYIRREHEPCGHQTDITGWGKVYKAELFTNLRFPEGYWYEDSIFAQIVWPLTKHV